MIGTVIVPLDGSKLAERALVYGGAIAERTEAPLLLARVASAGGNQYELSECRDYLREVASRYSGRVQLEVVAGRPAEKIIDVAAQVVDPIIVMSTRGQGGIRKWMTGSVADEVVRSSGDPVLLVRPEQEIPEHLSIPHIMVPVDGSSDGEIALKYAVEIARSFESELHLVRVVDTPSAYAMLSRHMETAVTGDLLDEIINSMTTEANEYLASLSEQLTEQGISVRTATLSGYPGDQLIEYERRGYFQLVVMATAGRSGMSRIVFGSVAERVLKLGRSPVMMIRPSEVQSAPEGDDV